MATAALTLLAGMFVAAGPPPAEAAETLAGVVFEPRTGAGTEDDPYLYVVKLDCVAEGIESSITNLEPNAELGKYYRIEFQEVNPSGEIGNSWGGGNNCPTSRSTGNISDDIGSLSSFDFTFGEGPPKFEAIEGEYTGGRQCHGKSRFASGTFDVELQIVVLIGSGAFAPGISRQSDWCDDGVTAGQTSGGTNGTDDAGASGGSTSVDPTLATVAFAVEQANAAGVAGSSRGVLIRGGQVVAVSSRLVGGVGPRGGVVLEAPGLRASFASTIGSRADAGVIVSQDGAIECEVCGAFVPGSVIEAWVNSDPRLVAAVRVDDDAAAGDCVLMSMPIGAPLDGGGAIESRVHTLQLRMFTADGFEVLSTGLTVGGVVPTGIPAGEGSVPGQMPLALLLAAIMSVGGAVLVGRRVLATG